MLIHAPMFNVELRAYPVHIFPSQSEQLQDAQTDAQLQESHRPEWFPQVLR
jgi:hypothetical protein